MRIAVFQTVPGMVDEPFAWASGCTRSELCEGKYVVHCRIIRATVAIAVAESVFDHDEMIYLFSLGIWMEDQSIAPILSVKPKSSLVFAKSGPLGFAWLLYYESRHPNNPAFFLFLNHCLCDRPLYPHSTKRRLKF